MYSVLSAQKGDALSGAFPKKLFIGKQYYNTLDKKS